MGNPTRRRWIKLYPLECIDGSIRYQLTPSERGVWYDLLNFSAVCSNDGTISDRDGRPYPLSFIASRLNITITLLKSTLDKSIEEGRLTMTLDGVISITNWTRYQSEYDRQKPYRQRSIHERNQQRLKEHPNEALSSSGYRDIPLEEREDDFELSRGKTSLEVHEEAMLRANPHLTNDLPE